MAICQASTDIAAGVQPVGKDLAEQLAARVPQVFSVRKKARDGCFLKVQDVRQHEHHLEPVRPCPPLLPLQLQKSTLVLRLCMWLTPGSFGRSLLTCRLVCACNGEREAA